MAPAADEGARLIGTRLILDPDLRFSELEKQLELGGWIRRPARTVLPPILPGEPELAQWASGSGEALLTYTLNPVVHLRVLDVSGESAASEVDGLARTLPVLHPDDLGCSLESNDVRTVVRGILAAAHLNAYDLAAPIGQLAGHRDPTVAETAARAHLDLLHAQALAFTRSNRLGDSLAITLGALAGNAIRLLAALPDAAPDEILGLRPTEEDYQAVFPEELAPKLFEEYEEMWQHPPRISPGSDRRQLRVHACPVPLLASDNAFSRPFPMRYRGVAPLLRQDRVWLAWKYCAPGSQSGLAFDGLVNVRENWVWFPKAYSVIMRVVGTGPSGVR
jgi:hypothetical protein